MVGLFQAVFVADAQVSRLRDVEVKLVKTGYVLFWTFDIANINSKALLVLEEFTGTREQ